MTFPGTPLSCDHDEYVRLKVSHVAFGKFNAVHAGKIERLKTLFGEMDRVFGLPSLEDPRCARAPTPSRLKARCSRDVAGASDQP